MGEGTSRAPGVAWGAGGPLVVTVSAPYGAGGSVIAPLLAERLGVRWIDRLVPAAAARETIGSSASGAGSGSGASNGPGGNRAGEALSDDEAASTPGSRLFAYLARVVGINGMVPPDNLVDHDEELRSSAEREIGALCAEGGVLLGRAGAVVLAGRPATVHVRLDGPPQRRLVRASEIEGIDAREAARRMADTDRARSLYVRRLYRADAADPSLYHLVLDTTLLPVDAAVGLLAAAVDAFRAGVQDW